MRKIFQIDLDPTRKFGLDILRCIAILCVVVEHGGNFLPENLKKINDLFVFDGVSLFFVLSGFLIGGILIKLLEKNQVIDRKLLVDFWIRRWFRTLPNYFLVLIILIILQVLFHSTSHFDTPTRTIYKWFIFSQNLITPHPWFFPEAWSLCIEEWFYLLIPFLIFTLIIYSGRTVKQAVLFAAVFILISITVFRYFRYENIQIYTYKDWDINFRKQVFTRLDSLMYGLIGAYLHFYFKHIWVKWKNQLLVLGIVIFILVKYILSEFFATGSLYNCVFSFSLTSLATLCLLPYLSEVKPSKGRIYRGITYISLISYSMYLLNYSLIQVWIVDRLEWESIISSAGLITVIKYLLFWFLVISLSALLYKYFEIPMTKLRDNIKVKRILLGGWGKLKAEG